MRPYPYKPERIKIEVLTVFNKDYTIETLLGNDSLVIQIVTFDESLGVYYDIDKSEWLYNVGSVNIFYLQQKATMNLEVTDCLSMTELIFQAKVINPLLEFIGENDIVGKKRIIFFWNELTENLFNILFVKLTEYYQNIFITWAREGGPKVLSGD